MPRRARLEVPGGIHHVTNRGTRKTAIFVDDWDRRFFLRRLCWVVRHRHWRCLAYCLMGNHVHLVIETPQPTLGAGMRDLLSLHARVFNARHGLRGTAFEARFDNRVVAGDEYFAQLLRYVALNPVKAGLAASPRDWPWSSHRALLGERRDPCVDRSRVTELLGVWGGEEWERYARIFEPGGSLDRRFGDAPPWESRPALDELLRTTGRRSIAAVVAREHGYRLAEIAAAAGVHESTVSRWVSDARKVS